jgi:hypothetical protein
VGPAFGRVGDEDARQLQDLADLVRTTLIAAGVPASADKPGPDGGAVIFVDLGADASGGVYISWDFPRAQHREVMNYLGTGQDSHPRVQYFFEVQRAMQEAIMAILHAAGLTAVREEDRNDLAPRMVLVPQQALPS